MLRKAQVKLLLTDKVPAILVPKSPRRMEYKPGWDEVWKDSDRYILSHFYFINDDNEVSGWTIFTENNRLRHIATKAIGGLYKKIVATTNPDLHKDGVARIDQDFVEAYIRQEGKITEVLLEYHTIENPPVYNLNKYKPDAIYTTSDVLKLRPNGSVIIHPVKERMYSREEVSRIVWSAYQQGKLDGENDKITDTEEWVNKNYPE